MSDAITALIKDKIIEDLRCNIQLYQYCFNDSPSIEHASQLVNLFKNYKSCKDGIYLAVNHEWADENISYYEDYITAYTEATS